jgi:hypothetical protein
MTNKEIAKAVGREVRKKYGDLWKVLEASHKYDTKEQKEKAAKLKKLQFKDIEIMAEFLCRTFYNGTQEKNHNVKEMTFKEYRQKSLINWIPTARGVLNKYTKGKMIIDFRQE